MPRRVRYRTTDFTRLAVSAPVDQQAGRVTAGGPWSGVVSDPAEQLAEAAQQAERCSGLLEAMGYPTPLWTAAQVDRRELLTRQLQHYEQLCHELRRVIRQATSAKT